MKKFQNTVQRLICKLSAKDSDSKHNFPVNENLVKRYTKSELARLYNRPLNTVMRWIHSDEELMQELHKSGYKKSQKELKKEQVRIIFEYLGEP